MSPKSFNIINAFKAEIVKFAEVKNLKKFYTTQADLGDFPKGAFSRNRAFDLGNMLRFMLVPRSKSTAVELLEYSHQANIPYVCKSAFSKRRNYIPASYLKRLHREMVSDFYRKAPLNLWHGRLLLAADGTTYSLPRTGDLTDRYLQGRKTGRGQQPLARGIVIKDVLNDIIVGSNMEAYGKDEIRLLIDELDSMPQWPPTIRPLVILDRKFCAYQVIHRLINGGMDFVIRVKSGFNPEIDGFIRSGEDTRDVSLCPHPTSRKKLTRLYGKGDYDSFPVRLVKLSGTVVVMTSVKDYPIADDDIYHKRWDDESSIGFMKNSLQVEIFSGSSNNALQQDFYSKTIDYNILSALLHQAAELRHDQKPRRINRNTALGIMKLNFCDVLEEGENNEFLQSMLKEMARLSVPVIPNRHNPRLFRKIKHSGKYITLTNYKRAI